MGIFGLGNSSTLYWPGSYSLAKHKSSVSNYKKIMKKLGIGFCMLDEMVCCGGILINAGYDSEARKLARENFQLFKKKGIKRIITSDPLCYKTFSKDYEEMMPDWDISVEFILNVVLDKLEQKPRLIKSPINESIIYHDPCYLGRYSGIYNPPRRILEWVGYNLIELKHKKENALCSGACGNLKQTNPELANEISNDLIKEIKLAGASVITPDSYVYNHLKENLKDILIYDFSEALTHALGIKW